MAPSISICISSYGDESWRRLAQERAYPSALAQGADEVLILHEPAGSIASCRNNNAARAVSDYLLFLDADDELDPLCVSSMREANVGPCLYVPKISYTYNGRRQTPKFWPEVPLSTANWLVIGTLVPRSLFIEIGGFADWPVIFEDYELWIRCVKSGAQIVKVPEAIYVAHWSFTSRNKRLSRQENIRYHHEIGRVHYPEIYNDAWLSRHSKRLPRTARARSR